MKVKLKKPNSRDHNQITHIAWKESEPFVNNTRGQLIHRVRWVESIRYYGEHRHLAVRYMCGGGTTGDTDENLEFCATVPKGRVLCARCEAQSAVEGQKTAEQLCRKKHVCKGGTVIVKSCGCGSQN